MNICSVSNSYLRFDKPASFFAAMAFGNCGYAFPAAMGAKVGRPDTTVWAVDGDGATPLHRAVWAGSERCVWALLDGSPDRGALVDAINRSGETALRLGYVLLFTQPPEAAVRARCAAIRSPFGGAMRRP